MKVLSVVASGPKNSTDVLIDAVPRMRRRRIWSINIDQGWALGAWILLRKLVIKLGHVIHDIRCVTRLEGISANCYVKAVNTLKAKS